MNIQLQHVIPNYFLEEDVIGSQLFNQHIEWQSPQRILINAQSGKGKTSLLHFLYGLRTCYTGEISINNQVSTLIPEKEWVYLRQHLFSVVFQDLKLFDSLSAADNVMMKNKLTDYKTEVEIQNYFQLLQIEKHYHKPLSQLSQGQRQRVAIIRALCQPFEFLLLDEPFSHLDEQNCQRIVQLVQEELTLRNAGLIISSLGNDYGFQCHQTYTL